MPRTLPGRPLERRDDRRAVVVALLVVAPTTWALHLTLSYWFVPVSCARGSALPMHLVTLGAVVVLAAALLVAKATEEAELDGGLAVMARLAVVLCGYFLGVVLVTGLVAVVMRPCA